MANRRVAKNGSRLKRFRFLLPFCVTYTNVTKITAIEPRLKSRATRKTATSGLSKKSDTSFDHSQMILLIDVILLLIYPHTCDNVSTLCMTTFPPWYWSVKVPPGALCCTHLC